MAFPPQRGRVGLFAAIFCYRKRISASIPNAKYSTASGSQAGTLTIALATSGFTQQKLFVPQSICSCSASVAFNTNTAFVLTPVLLLSLSRLSSKTNTARHCSLFF
jgi:hypothetical protein